MIRIISSALVFLFLLIMFVTPVRTSLNNVFRKHEVREEELIGAVATFNPKVKEIQTILYEAGFEPGIVDGAMGENTRDAIRLFQESNALKATGWVDGPTLKALEEVSQLVFRQKEEDAEQKTVAPGPPAVTDKAIQEVLRSQGFYKGRIDGKMGNQTVEAVKKFQEKEGLKADGLIGNETRKRIGQYVAQE